MSHQRKTLGAGKQPRAFIKKSQWRHCIASTAKELLAWWAAGLAIAVVFSCCTHGSRGTVAVALKGAGARNTQQLAVATPTDKRGFVTSTYRAGVSTPCLHGLGRDEAIRKDACTTSCVLRTSRPPYALCKATGGFKSQLGA